MKDAAEIINNAKKPLALVGQGVELGGAQKELREFLEKGDIPAGRTLLGLSSAPLRPSSRCGNARHARQLCA